MVCDQYQEKIAKSSNLYSLYECIQYNYTTPSLWDTMIQIHRRSEELSKD
jgi:hypothetical protein